MKEITLPELLEAGCHFGHQTVRWNPKMKPYIYGAKDGVHIFDLAKTKEGLERACEFVKEVVSKWSPPASASGAAGGGQGKILFLGTKRQAREVVEKVAKKVGMPYVSTRWLGGTLTNF